MKTAIESLNLKVNQDTFLSMLGIFIASCLVLFPFKYVVLGILFCGYVVCTLTRPQWPIYILIVLTPIARIPGLNDLIEPVVISMILITVLSWFLKLKLSTDENKRGFLEYKEFNLFLIIFIILMGVSLIASVNAAESIRMIIIHIAGLSSLYYFFDVLSVDRYLKKAVYLFLLISLAVALLALLQYSIMEYHIFLGLERFVIPAVHRLSLFENNTGDSLSGGYRSVGTFFHPNNLGAYLALSVPILISLLFSVRKFIQRIIICCIVGAIFLGIFCSGSRGALTNVLVSSLFVIIMYWKSISPRFKVYSGAICLLFFLMFSKYIIPFLRLSDGISSRDVIWQNTIQLIKDRPFTGHGMGTFSREYFPRFGFPTLGDMQTILDELLITGESNILWGIHAHNLFLNYAFEMGIAGAVLILFFYFCYLKTFVRFIRRKRNLRSFKFALAIGSTGALIGEFAHNFFDVSCFNFLPFSYSFVFIIAVGIILMHR
jgi:putative inorganic carbon (HCO3(-)) transporter